MNAERHTSAPAADDAPGAGRFWTASNVLSITRALLAIPFVLVMLSDHPDRRWWAVGILALAALTDRLDGDIARRFNQITEWGKILDPLADKIGVAAVAAVLLVDGSIPLWFLSALVLRDLLILAGGVYIRATKGLVLASNPSGKWAVGIVTLTLFAALVGAGPPWMEILLALSSALLVLSFAEYVGRFTALLRPMRTL